jgi:RND family efflux transporter MFP subunit
MQRALAKMEETQTDLTNTEIKAPVDGYVLLLRLSRWEELVGPGMSVRAASHLADIVNFATMRVVADISENEIEKLKKGQNAQITIPSLPQKKFRGIIKEIDRLAKVNDWQSGDVPGRKTFLARVELLDKDERLRPGMRASVEIRLEHITAGVMIPVEAIFEKGSKAFVSKQVRGSFQTVPVKVLKSNAMMTAVEGEIRPGDRVALAPPADFHLAAGEKP